MLSEYSEVQLQVVFGILIESGMRSWLGGGRYANWRGETDEVKGRKCVSSASL